MVLFAVVGALYAAASPVLLRGRALVADIAPVRGLFRAARPVAYQAAAFFAQVPTTIGGGGGGGQVSVNPTSSGLPGGAMAQKLIDWGGQIGLWGSLLSILVGAAIWGVSQQFGNGYQSGKGKTLVGAGAIGAILVGLAAIIVNTLFSAAKT
jgi:hypothetical protein